jgi:hypothetical protein
LGGSSKANREESKSRLKSHQPTCGYRSHVPSRISFMTPESLGFCDLG